MTYASRLRVLGHAAAVLGALSVCLSAFMFALQYMWVGQSTAFWILPTIPGFFVGFLADYFSERGGYRDVRWIVAAYTTALMAGVLAVDGVPFVEDFHIEGLDYLISCIAFPVGFTVWWNMRAWRLHRKRPRS